MVRKLLAVQFKVHPTVISKWKALLLENAASVFADGRSKKTTDDPNVEALFEKIGRLEVENDFLKKVRFVRLTPSVTPSIRCVRI